MTEQRSHRTITRTRTILLAGLLFDDAGHPMIATHASRNRVRYRYYVSQPNLRGSASAGSITRVPASDIESAVIAAVADNGGRPRIDKADQNLRNILVSKVARIEVRKGELAMTLNNPVAHDADERETSPKLTTIDEADMGLAHSA